MRLLSIFPVFPARVATHTRFLGLHTATVRMRAITHRKPLVNHFSGFPSSLLRKRILLFRWVPGEIGGITREAKGTEEPDCDGAFRLSSLFLSVCYALALRGGEPRSAVVGPWPEASPSHNSFPRITLTKEERWYLTLWIEESPQQTLLSLGFYFLWGSWVFRRGGKMDRGQKQFFSGRMPCVVKFEMTQ